MNAACLNNEEKACGKGIIFYGYLLRLMAGQVGRICLGVFFIVPGIQGRPWQYRLR